MGQPGRLALADPATDGCPGNAESAGDLDLGDTFVGSAHSELFNGFSCFSAGCASLVELILDSHASTLTPVQD